VIPRDTLITLRGIAVWGGVFVTLSGIIYNISKGGDIVGAYISLVGILMTSFGHIVTSAIARYDAQIKQSTQEKIEFLEDRLSETESAMDAPYIRRIASEYADEHQDDGR
jgi:hypothetical protein